MERLNSIHRNALKKIDFETFPVWGWDEEQEGYHPLVGEGTIPPEHSTVFVSARFITAAGYLTEGYLIGRDSFFAIGLFIGDDVYIFNRNAPDLAKDEAIAFAAKIGMNPIFPIRYTTRVGFDGKPPLEGLFDV